MNTQSNAMPHSPVAPQAAPTIPSATHPLYWSVRRELWEFRSIYLGPAGIAAVFLFGFLISLVHLRLHVGPLLALSPDHQLKTLQQPYNYAAGLIMGIAFIVQLFYCVEALHSERRDRSILFWKSVPVSDSITVLAKASIPLIVLPVIALAVLAATYLIMLLLSTAALLGSGISAGTLWTQIPVSQILLALLYHLATVHVLWYAPIYGWLLLVSGWARRMPFLWAVLPPLAIYALEQIAFHTSHFGTMLLYRLSGPENFMFPSSGAASMDATHHLDLGKFLSTPGVWTGLVVFAAFLVLAIWQRRYRGPI